MASQLPYDAGAASLLVDGTPLARRWIAVFGAFVFACLLSFAAFPDAWLGMGRVWWESETYTHGFIALPCAAWMIWRRRQDWAALPQRAWWPALAAVAGCGLLWLAGRLGGVASLEQIAAVALIPSAVLLLSGPAVVRALAFPLAFVFFAVPVGDFLTPIMMDYTADATVTALRWTGVPVYREGLHFMVPTGRWSVVEACSGLRYLIASLALGVLYAYLQFRTLRYRLGFMALAIVVPIVANWVRAYMIVMLGHLSNMKIATGVDHLIYGWIFFGVVMGLLFWFGSRWREPAPPDGQDAAARSPAAGTDSAGVADAGSGTSRTGTRAGRTGPSRPMIAAAAAAAVSILVWRPVAAGLLDMTHPRQVGPALRASLQAFPAAPALPFEPAYVDARETIRVSHRIDGAPVELYAYYYARQFESQEMIHTKNALVRLNDARWPIRASDSEPMPWGTVASYRLGTQGGENLLVWTWYAVGGVQSASAYRAKAATAASLALGRGDHSLVIVLATPIEGERSAAVQAARARLAEAAAAIEPAVDTSTGGRIARTAAGH
ncbi:MAG: exosortase A [Burkholderiales bacterium]|nr:exosortase A [Burkholderiales bacterium]OJX08657.1 MAG: hypothetical protein BGO72_15540 [Burkholderiales bacterium 70-64]